MSRAEHPDHGKTRISVVEPGGEYVVAVEGGFRRLVATETMVQIEVGPNAVGSFPWTDLRALRRKRVRR